MRKEKTKRLIPYAYVTAFAASHKQHGTSLNDGSQPTMQFEKDKNSMSGYVFHIMQNEMNVTNRFTTNQRKLESTRDWKKKRETWRGSDLRERHLRSHDSASLQGVCSACWAHCCLIQHWHHLHIPMPPICQFAHSPMIENSASTPEAWRVSATAALKAVNVKSLKLFPASLGGTLHACFPVHTSETEIWYRGSTRIHFVTDVGCLPPCSVQKSHFDSRPKQMIIIKRSWSFRLNYFEQALRYAAGGCAA